MGQPERRRRRVRPSSASAGAATGTPTADSTAPAEPVTEPGAASTVPVPGPPMPGPAVPGPAVPGPPVPAPPPVPGPPPRSAAVTALGAPGRPSGSAAVTAPESESPRPSTDNGGQRPSRGGPPRRAGSGPGGEDREAERGLRGLVGSGSSQVSVGAALRARDASRPTDEDLAEAEESLPIVRRNWLPREELPRR